MKVFLSWSGGRSHAVAELLDEWLRCVVQAADPWLSSEGIERGSVWFSEISGKLSDTSVGIICLTEENKNKPWILFEAGAISKGLTSSRVCTLLIDLKHHDIENPLAQFNHTEPTQSGMWNLVQTINSCMGDKALREAILKKVFETNWPDFKSRLEVIQKNTLSAPEPKKRKDGDMMSEVLDAVRSMERRMLRIEEVNAHRTSKERSEERSGLVPSSEARNLVQMMVRDGVPDELILSRMEGLAPPGWVQRRIGDFKGKPRFPTVPEENNGR